jgi:uncharacterized protein YbbK (DUF523 family)/uncharacterized protein YbgA (DUF1722 family)
LSEPLLRLGVSACLLGEEVRWNGGHKRTPFLTETLQEWVEWVPICPEVEIGLGIPRPTVRLEDHGDSLRMVEPVSGDDCTDKMLTWSNDWIDQMGALDGFVLKKGSPSCGPDRVKRFVKGMPNYDASGLFAGRLMALRPWLPIVDDGRLHAATLREKFFDHAMWMRRWRDAGGTKMGAHELMTFHRDHKMTYLSHQPAGTKILGQLAAVNDTKQYLTQAGIVMTETATAGRHMNVMQHLAGFFSDQLSADDRQELTETIQQYGQGLVPFLVPLTLLHHHVRRCDVPDWLHGQTYLNPYPKEWVLRHGL